MPIKPVHPGDAPLAPGPTATPAEHRWFAEDNAYHSLLKKRWDDWVLAHPDDAEITAVHSFTVDPAVITKPPDGPALGLGPAPHDPANTPPPPPNPRPDGTSARRSPPGGSGL
jgi:hypothetical protein